jgi:CPA1 family monovalent cation:H+ antiporter
VTHEVSTGVAAFVALLGVALLLSIAAERIRIPPAVMLVAVGAVVGSVWHVGPPFAFGPTVFFVFLPPLIFEAAWNIDLRLLQAQAARVAFLAVPGTLLCAFAVAGAVTMAGALPLASALLLGATISATDPVAVVAVFRHANVPAAIKTLVEAESLSNDGVAVVLYGLALAAAGGGSVAWLPAIGVGLVQIAGGMLVGALCAVPIWALLRGTRAPEYEVTATVALAYVAYLAADRLALSGIFATASAAVMLRALLHRRANLLNRDDVDRFWNSSAAIANAAVFLATGLLIDVPRAMHEPALVAATIVAVLLSRALLSLAAGPSRATRVTVFLAGMRSALPLALALALPAVLPHRSQIVDAVFATVLVTLVLQGASLEPVVTRLYGRATATDDRRSTP